MNVQIIANRLHETPCDALVVSAMRVEAGDGAHKVLLSSPAKSIDGLLNGALSDISRSGEFRANAGELATIHTLGLLAAKRIILVGLGAQQNIQARTLIRSCEIAARSAQQSGVHRLALAPLWQDTSIAPESGVQAQGEGALLGIYTFRKYQHTEHESNSRGITHVQLVLQAQDAESTLLENAARRGQALAEATNFARDLVNEPPNVLTPSELANRASAMARQFGLECEVFDKEQMEQWGMGGLLAVTRGSAEPPKFIVVRYRSAQPRAEKGIALVGKGITFDTGGISLKSPERMDEMKGDMGGAAAVLGAMQAIAVLQPTMNVTALIPTCENMPSGTAYHPGDIIRIMNGKTIEIVNTDAEGRLILADALSYAVREGLTPIIDLATLTGGVTVALGHVMTGLFCNDEQLTQDLLAAGRIAGEKFWPMPLDDEYMEQIKSDIADIKQTGGRPASSVTAAKILQQFVGEAHWVHLDIAGTSYVESKKPYQEKGGTGVGVRTLAEFVLRRAR